MITRREEIRMMCESLDIAEGKLSDEYIFTLEAVDLFFFEKNLNKDDIQLGFVDGARDGGIDFIFNNDDTVFFVQGKSSEKFSYDDIRNVFTKMKETVDLLVVRSSFDRYSKQLSEAFLNALDNCTDNYPNFCFILFTGSSIAEKDRARILELEESEVFENYQIKVYDSRDIEEKQIMFDASNSLIPEGSLELYSDGGKPVSVLRYSDNGLIINISAKSLKRLYDKHHEKLFNYNLRDFVPQKNVDEGIATTIRKEPMHFWFYNNGITVGCEDFNQSGNKITFYKFSIINGAQTTTQIGKCLVEGGSDFALVCKVIKANKFEQDAMQDFIGRISEATNSQKPIKARDIKANAREQLLLKRNCAKHNPPIYVEIKRGTARKLRKSEEKWQKVTNEYIGQLICSCLLQRPGTARNSKTAIFSNDSLYNSIFKRKHDIDTIYDLVRMGAIFDKYVISLAENGAKCDDDKQKASMFDDLKVAKNGKFSILALCLYLHLRVRGVLSGYADNNLHDSSLISGLFITNYPKDDLEERLFSLFSYIVYRLKQLYERISVSKGITSYSNFFKSDSYYIEMLQDFDILLSQSWELGNIKTLIAVIQ